MNEALTKTATRRLNVLLAKKIITIQVNVYVLYSE